MVSLSILLMDVFGRKKIALENRLRKYLKRNSKGYSKDTVITVELLSYRLKMSIDSYMNYESLSKKVDFLAEGQGVES